MLLKVSISNYLMGDIRFSINFKTFQLIKGQVYFDARVIEAGGFK